jgi:hypothetical protein
LVKIDAQTNSVTAEIALDGQEGVDVATNGIEVWVLVRGAANALSVVKLNATSNAIENVAQVGTGSPRHLALTGSSIVVTALGVSGGVVGNHGTVVTSLDASTMKVVAQVNDPHLLFGLASAQNGELWAAFDGGLEQISPDTGRPIGPQVSVDMGIDGLVSSGEGLWFFGPSANSSPTAGLFSPSTGVLYGPGTLPVSGAIDLTSTSDALWVGSNRGLVSLAVSKG